MFRHASTHVARPVIRLKFKNAKTFERHVWNLKADRYAPKHTFKHLPEHMPKHMEELEAEENEAAGSQHSSHRLCLDMEAFDAGA